jgi:SH3 domain-containing YSC84-like protein 1
MIRRTLIGGTSAVALLTLSAASAWAQVYVQPNPAEATVVNATTSFAQAMVMPQNEIPRSMLTDAQAVIIVPGMVRGAFVFGAQFGRGILVMRDATGTWQPPRFVVLTGGSVGYQIGVQATDLVLVFRTQQSVANLLRGTLKVGVDASAAAGPVGRQTSAGTDFQTQAEILSYSRARGAFIGVSIDGTVISLDPGSDQMYYQTPGVVPASTVQLLQTLTAYSAVAMPAVGVPMQAAAAGVGGGWVAAGSQGGNAEATRQQLDQSSRQLFATLDDSWRRYLALPPDVTTPGQVPNPQALQQVTARYEDVSRRPEYAALQTRPEFQATLRSLRQLGEVRTASNSTLQLPPPPR